MNIAILKDTTESIQLFIGGAVTTNELEWSAFYFDEVSGTQTLSSSNGVSNGTTDVEVIAAPSSGQRVVKEIVVYNADTVSATITVQFVEAANDRRIVTKTLSANSAWVFSDTSDGAASGASDLDGLSDVTLSGVAQGDILRRGATDWNNTNIATNEVVARIAGDVEGLAVGASTVVGRKSTGDIVALTASEGRTVFDVDISGTDNSTDVTLAGTPDYLTIVGQVITRGAIDLTTDTTGTLAIGDGGSGIDASATGPGVWQQRTNGSVVSVLKHNFTATVAPVATDDTGSGYEVGSNWYDVTADKAYVALDVTSTAAVWTETTQAGTSGATTALDNLASVAINDSLISDTDSTDSLGSTGIKWLDAFLDRATFDELAAPATPAAGDVRLYAKTDGLLYSKDDVGTETLVSGGAGGGGTMYVFIPALFSSIVELAGLPRVRTHSGISSTSMAWFVPADFTSLTSMYIYYIPDATNTVTFETYADYGADGTAYTTHSASDTTHSVAETANQINRVDVSGLVGSLAVGDALSVQLVGNAAGNANDLSVYGLAIVYA